MRQVLLGTLILALLCLSACGSSTDGGDQQAGRVKPGLNEKNIEAGLKSVSNALRGLDDIMAVMSGAPRRSVPKESTEGIQLLVMPESELPLDNDGKINWEQLRHYQLIRVDHKERIYSFIILERGQLSRCREIQFKRSVFEPGRGWVLKARLTLVIQRLTDGRRLASARFWIDPGSALAGIRLRKKMKEMKVEVYAGVSQLASKTFRIY